MSSLANATWIKKLASTQIHEFNLDCKGERQSENYLPRVPMGERDTEIVQT
jgi:hypothetical protein